MITWWVVGVTEDVVEVTVCVARVVSGCDGVGLAEVVRKVVPVGGPGMWVVVETGGVGAE